MMTGPDFNPLFARIPDLQMGDEAFLADIFSRFPKVQAGFEEFAGQTPFARIPAAAQKLEHLPRTGWLRLEKDGHPRQGRTTLETHGGEYFEPRWLFMEQARSKGTETVLEHCIEAQELFILVYSKTCPFLQWGIEVMKFHDFTEAVVGDFTPHDTITKPEKKRLERIALGLLTEDRHNGNLHARHVYNCMRIFEGDVTDFSAMSAEMLTNIRVARDSGKVRPHQVQAVNFFERIYRDLSPDLSDLTARAHDIDALQMGLRAMRIGADKHFSVPIDQAHATLQEFYNYIDPKLVTPEARLFFQELQKVNQKPMSFSYPDAAAVTFAQYWNNHPPRMGG